MLRSFEFTIINTCFDRSLVYRRQLHKEGVGTRISSFQQNLKRCKGINIEVIKLGQLKLEDGMNVDPCLNEHTCSRLENIHVKI